jgi:hypothetical protein
VKPFGWICGVHHSRPGSTRSNFWACWKASCARAPARSQAGHIESWRRFVSNPTLAGRKESTSPRARCASGSLPTVIKLRLEHQNDLDEKNQEFVMGTQDIYQAWLERTFAEGEACALLFVLATRGLTVSDEQAAQIRGKASWADFGGSRKGASLAHHSR